MHTAPFLTSCASSVLTPRSPSAWVRAGCCIYALSFSFAVSSPDHLVCVTVDPSQMGLLTSSPSVPGIPGVLSCRGCANIFAGFHRRLGAPGPMGLSEVGLVMLRSVVKSSSDQATYESLACFSRFASQFLPTAVLSCETGLQFAEQLCFFHLIIRHIACKAGQMYTKFSLAKYVLGPDHKSLNSTKLHIVSIGRA
jgi:hypothetical protein